MFLWGGLGAGGMQERGLGAALLPGSLLEEVPPQVLEETTVLWESEGLDYSPKSATKKAYVLGPVSHL